MCVCVCVCVYMLVCVLFICIEKRYRINIIITIIKSLLLTQWSLFRSSTDMEAMLHLPLAV